MKKLLVLVLIIAFIAVLIVFVPTVRDVLANPNNCPKGQEKKAGCKWVQHVITGKCQWLPAQAVASPWKVVAEGSCPALPAPPTATAIGILATPTPYQPWTPTATKDTLTTAIPRPTDLPVCTPTKPLPTAVPTWIPDSPIPIQITAAPTDPTATITPLCDECKIKQQEADARSTEVAIQATRLSWEMTKNP